MGHNCGTISCFGKAPSDPEVCSGNGECVGPNNCTCDSIYYTDVDCVDKSTQSLYLELNNYYSNMVIGPCSNFEINVTSKMDRSVVNATYSWTLVYSSSLNSSMSLMAYLENLTDGQLSIPYKYLLPGYEYVLNVTATNGSSFGSRAVYFYKLPVQFSASILSPSNIVIRRDQKAVFYADIDSNIDQCLSIGNATVNWWISTQNLTFPISSARAVLQLPELSFPEPGDYTITLMGQLLYFQSVSTVNVQVLSDPPTVQIIGGNMTMSVNTPNTLDIYSNDPEYPNANLTYSWSCLFDNRSPCPSFSNDKRTPIFSTNTTGTYTITVLMQSMNGRTATDTIEIQVIDTSVPIIKIMNNLPPVISTEYKLMAQSLVFPFYQLYDVEMQWSINQILPNGATQNLILNDTNLLVESTGHRSLVLKPNVLEPGSLYQVTVTAKNRTSSARSSSSVMVQTSTQPYSTSPTSALTITPSIGNSTETEFTFSANNWTTDNFSFPLQYSFEYFEELTGTWKVLSPFTYSNILKTKIFSILPSGLVQVKCIVRNYYGEEAEVFSNVTVLPILFTDDQILQILEKAELDFINNGYSLTPKLGYKILQISVAMIAYDGVYNSTLISEFFAFLEFVIQYAMSSDYISQQIGVLEIITLRAQALLEQGTDVFISLANSLLDNSISSSTFHNSIVNSGAQIISNIIAANVSMYQMSILPGLLSNTTQAIQLLSDYLLSDMIPEQNASVVSTESFSLAVQPNYVSTLFNQTISISGMIPSVFIPESNSIPQDNDTNVYNVQFISYNNAQNMIWQLQNITNGTNGISSGIVTFRILDSNGNKIPFETSNENPLIITVAKMMNNTGTSSNNSSYVCKYYDELVGDTQWGTRGCWLFDESNTSITCHCNHTTSFAAFIQYSSQELATAASNVERAVYFISIAFNIVFMILIIAVMLFLAYHRNKQPIRSRIYAPFIALFALLVECVLQGIVRNSMLSVKDRQHLTEVINIVGYVIVVISVPLSIVGLFVYLWQNVRYFLLRYLYELMDIASVSKTEGKKSNWIMSICHLLVSKPALFSICFVIYLVLFLYYLALSIAGGVKSEGSTTVAKALTITSSTSYLAILCLIGIGIIMTFVLDFVLVPFRQQQKQRADRLKAVIETQSSENDVPKFQKEKGIIYRFFFSLFDNHFRKEDPFYFRIDSLTISCAVLVGFVSFGIGIAANYVPQSNNSGPNIVFMLFDFLYTILRILAFGGILCIIRLIDMYKYEKNGYSYLQESAQSNNVEETSKTLENKIKDIIQTPVGYELFRNYCIKEFALENLLVYSELSTLIEEWANFDDATKKKAFDAFFDKFIKSGSKFEVNIPAHVRKSMVEFKKDVLNITEQQKAFSKLMSAVLTNLSDTFSRLYASKEYERYMAIGNMQRILKDVSLSANNES
jgi:hypothetical protein